MSMTKVTSRAVRSCATAGDFAHALEESLTGTGPTAPAATPQPIIQKIAADLRKVLKDPQVAQQIATQGGRAIKELRNARMGVVQINPLYSSSTSWEGNNDTSSVEKTIIATVTTTFAMK